MRRVFVALTVLALTCASCGGSGGGGTSTPQTGNLTTGPVLLDAKTCMCRYKMGDMPCVNVDMGGGRVVIGCPPLRSE